MRVETVRIQKFRSIDDATIRIDQVLAMVGANNSGKSHVLRAINAFFNFQEEREHFISKAHQYNAKSRPKVTVTFCDIEEADNIPEKYVYDAKLTLAFVYRWDRNTMSYEYVLGRERMNIDAETFGNLLENFTFIYIPVVRDYFASFSAEHGIAYNLLSLVYQQQTANRNTVQPKVDELYKKVKDTVFKKTLDRIVRYYPFADNSCFRLEINDKELVSSILRDISLHLEENAQSNEISNCGSGVQSAVYFAISLALSVVESKSHLIGIEEPELNMHPQAQRQLVEALKNITKYPNTQFLLTTHSSVLIDKLGHSSIALCRKGRTKTRDIVTSITQLGADFLTKYGMKEDRYINYFEFRNSDFFFSNFIIIAESSIDCSIIKILLETRGIDTETQGISFIPMDGEKSIKYPYALSKELNIPFLCVVDMDVFLPYSNDKRTDSLDANGLPTYRYEKKGSSPIYDLLNVKDGDLIVQLMSQGSYQKALDILEKYSIISMRHSFEIDLASCASFQTHFYDYLNLSGANRTQSNLFTNYGTRIKGVDILKEVITRGPKNNLPVSYRKIISATRAMIQDSNYPK